MANLDEMEKTAAEQEQNAFPVDLDREEYIKFNLLIARNGGLLRFRKGQIFLSLTMLLFSLGMIVYEKVIYNTVDTVMLLMVLFIGVTGSLLLFGIPTYIRRSAGRAYDQSLMGGYDYFGMVRVYPDRIEKDNGSTVSVVRFADNAGYIETSDMMILLSSSSRAIVLPARCMTGADADMVRRVVLPGIPIVRQRLLDRMVPRASHRMSPPDFSEERTAPEELVVISLEYQPAEFTKMMSDSALRAYVRMLPLYSGLALLSAIMFGLLSGLGVGILVFLGILGVLLLLNMMSARSRAAMALQRMPYDGMKLRLSLTEQGIVLRAANGEDTRFGWNAIRRAVERPDCVEFYTTNSFIRVPKRCIEDMEQLRRVVDAHIHPKTSA